MADPRDWVAVGVASVLLAAAVFALGAALPRRTMSGARAVAGLKSFGEAMGGSALSGAGERPLAIALGLTEPGDWIAEAVRPGAPGAAGNAAIIRALRHALGSG
jgi:hypothetical protein